MDGTTQAFGATVGSIDQAALNQTIVSTDQPLAVATQPTEALALAKEKSANKGGKAKGKGGKKEDGKKTPTAKTPSSSKTPNEVKECSRHSGSRGGIKKDDEEAEGAQDAQDGQGEELKKDQDVPDATLAAENQQADLEQA